MTTHESAFPTSDNVPVQDPDIPSPPDNLSEPGNFELALERGPFDEVRKPPDVRLRGMPRAALSVPGKGVPEHVVRDCDTMPPDALRKKYSYTANSHRKTLERAPERGHFVAPVWRWFSDFLRSMGPRPDDTTLHRINNDDPEYGPGKCVWAPPSVQNNAKGDTLTFTHSVTGENWTASEIAHRQRCSISAIEKRRARGWTDDEVIEGRRCPPCPQARAGTAAPPVNADPGVSVKLAARTSFPKEASSADDMLIGVWENFMREMQPEAVVHLAPKERRGLRAFGDYLRECDLGHRKAEVLGIILRNWSSLAIHAACDAGYPRERAPATPCPVFLADHMRRFVSRVFTSYRPVRVEDLNFSDPEPVKPAPASVKEPTPAEPAPADPAPADPAPADPGREWLADHPVTFEEYQREVWLDCFVHGTRESYEEGVVQWFDRRRSWLKPKQLHLLPTYVQEIIIRKKQLDLAVVAPPPANPASPPERFCPETYETIWSEPVEHPDPLPQVEPGSEISASPLRTAPDVGDA